MVQFNHFDGVGIAILCGFTLGKFNCVAVDSACDYTTIRQIISPITICDTVRSLEY